MNLVRSTGGTSAFLRPRSGARKHVTGLRPAGTKGRSFRGATRFRRPIVAALLSPTGRTLRPPIGAALITLALCAGAYLVRPAPPPLGPEAPGSIRRRFRPGSHQPPGLCAGERELLVPIVARCSVVGAESRQAAEARQ